MTEKAKKTLLSNFFSLSILQGANYVLPLITLPYLIRVLGVEKFGLINFAAAIIMYFNILVSFGFELSATRMISMQKSDLTAVSRIFSSVMMIKLVFIALSLVVLSLLMRYLEIFQGHILLYYLTFGIVMGNALFPVWLFQGFERMKYITSINLVTKIVFTSLIFIFVHSSADYFYVPLLNSLGAIAAGLISLWVARAYFSIRFSWPGKNALVEHLKDSFHFFLSRVANNGSRYYAGTIIGLYFGNTTVGYYYTVEKMYFAFTSLIGIVSQTIYPHMTRTRNVRHFKIIFLISMTGVLALLLIVLLFHAQILYGVSKINNEMLSNIFLIMFSAAIFDGISTLIGFPLLAAFGHIKYANNSLIYASLAYVLYITTISAATRNIYLVTSSIVLYTVVDLLIRIHYVNKTRVLVLAGEQ